MLWIIGRNDQQDTIICWITSGCSLRWSLLTCNCCLCSSNKWKFKDTTSPQPPGRLLKWSRWSLKHLPDLNFIYEDGMKFWSIQTSSKTLYSQTSSNDIEMTSYVMMTYVARDDVSSALPIMRWLISKRNDLGGFYSTQVKL